MTWWRSAIAYVRGWIPRSATIPTHRFSAGAPGTIDAAIAGLLPGVDTAAVTRISRTDALQVAAVLRARNELAAIATLPLRLYVETNGQTVDSALLRQIDTDVANVVTLAQTIEDMLFEGVGWWRVTLRDFAGYPVAARHIDAATVSLEPPTDAGSPAPLPSGQDPRGAVLYVDGQPVPARDLLRFDSPNPGLLLAAARSVRRALLLDQLARTYADNPRPLDYFTESDDPGVRPMDDADVPLFLARWRASRKRSGTAWIPGNVRRVDVSAPSPAELQLVELQKQCTLDIANATGIDPEDLGVSITSRTYFNAVDRAQQKINRTYAPYMTAIAQRLSMGDVTRRGQVVRFDLTDYLKPDPSGQAAYWGALMDMGVTDAAEVRGWAGLPGSPPQQPAPQRPTPLDEAAVLATTHRFDGATSGHRLTFAVARFAVDGQARSITGVAVPWSTPSSPDIFGYRTQFEPGSLEWSDVARVKHLRDHVLPVGKATRLEPTREGLAATVDVQPGADGDALLQGAVHGTYDGFSVGVEYSADPDDGDVVVDESARLVRVLRAQLREISTTALPAFDDARHTAVHAHQGGSMPCPLCGHPHPAGVACTRWPQTAIGYGAPAAPQTAIGNGAPQTAIGFGAAQTAIGNGAPQSAIGFGAAQTAIGNGAPAAPQSAIGNGDVMTAPAFAQLPPGASEQQLTQTLAAAATAAPAPAPTFVDPRHRPLATVTDPDPYRVTYTRRGDPVLHRGTHDFSTDLRAYWVDGDLAAGQRALTWAQRQFAVVTGDVPDLNPPRQRPELYVDQREYQYPVWDAINKGTLSDITPFIFPKFESAGGLVAPHTEGQEPTPGTFLTTSQTVTPSANSGKAKISREVWEQGGNPQISTLIWTQMLRGWYESLEASAVAVLDAATPTQILLTTGGGTAGELLVAELGQAMAGLQFIRGGFTMNQAFAQVDLYQGLVGATDAAGAPLLPMLNPSNRNGTTTDRYGSVVVAGVPFHPTWALAATGAVAASSYLFDSASVHGWASAPQRLTMDMTEVANIYLGIWGYQATAISDLSGVREIVYDPSAAPLTQEG